MVLSNYFNAYETDFPKMIWLGDEGLYEKVIFIRNPRQFTYMIEELSYYLHRNNFTD